VTRRTEWSCGVRTKVSFARVVVDSEEEAEGRVTVPLSLSVARTSRSRGRAECLKAGLLVTTPGFLPRVSKGKK
jgi:hypothetical protein